jgi:ribosome maturation protein Sdo1
LKLDIANIIVKMTVNETDGNKFPVSIILKAMNEVNCKVNGNKPAKPQALAFIPELKKVIPIERSRMQLRITFTDSEQALKLLEVLNSKFSSQFSMTSNRQ